MTYDNVITSKGKQKRYFCDYCHNIFDKSDGREVKTRWLSIGWPHYWKRYFMCDDCYYSKLRRNNKGEYID